MKRTVATLIVGAVLVTASFAGQFRIAGLALTPVETVPEESVQGWAELMLPTEDTLTGWQWEVAFRYFGLGMHYGVGFYQPETEKGWLMDWKGDFFLSYHIMGSGSTVDPFVEVGWGNAGTTTVSSPSRYEYPDWEEEVADGDALELALYTYVAGGVAFDLNGLLLGARVCYYPSSLAEPIPATDIAMFDLADFDIGVFAGVALGGHDRQWRH
jgi:hypothetical protein